MQTRYSAVDALRGFIMILMAIDHASAFLARQHSSEFWAGAMSAYTSAFPFLTRWITHLCAPGFFFLVGAGIYWFASSRRQSGWTQSQTIRRTAVRGLAILTIGQLLENPVLFLQSQMKPAAVSLSQVTAPPPIDGSDLYWGFITLSGLGAVMIVCALLLRLPSWDWLLTSAACVIATHSLLPVSGKPGPLWMALLLTPGLSQHVFVVYPIIPWLAIAAAGMYFAHWWQSNPTTAENRIWIIGLALVLAAIALRAAGGWGNIRPPRDAGWIEFLNNVKYPPSLVFWTMAVGIDLLVLALLVRAPQAFKSETSPLIVFGQTPLFFYLVHFYLLMAAGFAFFPEAGPLEQAYAGWFAVLILLYPVCARYRKFKLSKPPESFWRLL
ncbi:MAG: DUF1624 domain-containing protein [Bryobacterales bacterium]|nr:DUF1624 domain-containing protein [Bryobacterales bacterium]